MLSEGEMGTEEVAYGMMIRGRREGGGGGEGEEAQTHKQRG